MKENKSKKMEGFTLVELLVVITIIAILSSIAVYGLSAVRSKAQDTTKLSNIREVEIGLEAYKSVNGKYPSASDYSTSGGTTSFAPTFIKKAPTPATEYLYFVSSDQKSYCFNVRSTVFNAPSQADLVDSLHPKSWQVCKGSQAGTLASQ